MKYCFTANQLTPCTEHCKDCAKEIYDDLKAQFGKAEYVSEESIIDRVGERSLYVLKQYGFIETCGVIDGTKFYTL